MLPGKAQSQGEAKEACRTRWAAGMGTNVACGSRSGNNGGTWVSARPTLAHYIQDLHLVTVLDELRDAYELSKEKGQSELQSQLLRIRRRLLDALHESLNLYGENAELHQQLGEAQAEIRQLRARGARPAMTIETLPARTTRKLS